MPIKRSEIQNKRTTLSVPFMDGELNLVVVPSRLSWSAVMDGNEKMQEAQDDKAKAKFAIGQLVAVAESWDYLDDDEKPLDVTPEYLMELPVDVVNSLFEQFRGLFNIPKKIETESI